MTLAGFFHLPGTPKQFGRCLAIHIAWVGARPLCQNATAIWRSIQGRNSPAHTHIPEGLSFPVKQCEAVMRDSRFKEAGFDKADHHIDWAASYPQVCDQTFFFTLLQYLDGTTPLHRFCKGNMLRIVEIDELQLLQAQQAQAALDAAPHLRASEDAGLQIAVSLGCQHEARRDPTNLAEYDADAALALAIAIGGGSIQEVEGTGKENTNCGQGALLLDAIGESLRHTPQWGGANTDGRHLQACRA